MSHPIKKFSGHQGIVVQDTGSKPGVIDSGDTAERAGSPVRWDDPAYVAARDDFGKTERRISEARRQLEAKPARRGLEAIADTMAEIAASQASPALRAEAGVLVAGAQGIILRDHIWRIRVSEVKRVGKEAFSALQKAIADDPTNADAWYGYAKSVLGVRHSSMRGMAESTLGIEVRECLPLIVKGLGQFPKGMREQLTLELILQAKSLETGLSPDETALLAAVRARLPALVAAQPAKAAEIIESLREHREEIENEQRRRGPGVV